MFCKDVGITLTSYPLPLAIMWFKSNHRKTLCAMILTCLFILPGIPNVTGQQNPYAPEVSIYCTLYGNWGEKIITQPGYDDSYFQPTIDCDMQNNNNVDINVEISWDWINRPSIYPILTNGEEINIPAQSYANYQFTFSADMGTNPDEYDFTLTTLVTSYANGIINCDTCKSEEYSWTLEVIPWIMAVDLKITDSDLEGVSAPYDMDAKCDDELDAREKIITFELEFLTNTKDDLRLSIVSSAQAYYIGENTWDRDSHYDEGEPYYSEQAISGGSNTLSFEAKYSIDFDDERKLDSAIEFYIEVSIEHSSYLIDDNWFAWEFLTLYGECNLEKNIFEDSNSTNVDGGIVVNLPFASSGLTIITISLGAILFRRGREAPKKLDTPK